MEGLGTLPTNLDNFGLYPHTLSPPWSEPPGLLRWPPHWFLASALEPASIPHAAARKHPGAPVSDLSFTGSEASAEPSLAPLRGKLKYQGVLRPLHPFSFYRSSRPSAHSLLFLSTQ